MASRKSRDNASNNSSDASTSFRTAPDGRTAKLQFTPPAQNSPRKIRAGQITQAQKQALIDNLQLEITERARKLRAQYATQALHLRERLEMRINRIPSSLRNRKMQDLIDEHAEKARPKPAPPMAVSSQQRSVIESPKRGVKRPSDNISHDDAEESGQGRGGEVEELRSPKKRAKTAATTTAAAATVNSSTANTKPTRTAAPPTVLSPKSQNANASQLPRSPVRVTEKPASRLPSPHKPLPAPPSTTTANKAGPGRKPSKQQLQAPAAGAKTAAAGQDETAKAGRSSDASEASNTSAGTTVVKKAGTTTAKGKLVPPKKTAVGGAKAGTAGAGGGKKAAAAVKKENVPPPPATRSLRKRG